MSQPATVRRNPCDTCPYRRDVPSGIWDASEYAKLPGYDGETWAQTQRPFHCHTDQPQICAGWAGHRNPADMLAVRLGVAHGGIDPSIYDYSTRVPLFASGAEAAEHGMRDLPDPSERARNAVRRIVRRRRR